MQFKLVRALGAVLLVAAAAACGDSPSESRSPAGTYGGYAVTVEGTTSARTIPAVLYDGAATADGVTYNVRHELLSSAVTLVESGRQYTFTATYRLTEKDGRFPTDTETTVETGTYTIQGDEITFNQSANSDIFVEATGTIRNNNNIVVGAYDPFFDELNEIEFRR